MTKWAMVIDLDKCTACQSCTAACRQENNIPFAGPQETVKGRAIFWNEVLTKTEGEYPNVKIQFIPRPCMHCEKPPCVQVCPVGATFQDEEGLVRQNYHRCIGCRYCMTACPYGARFFNWSKPEFPPPLDLSLNPDPEVAVRPKGVVEKCTFCIQRIRKAKQKARAEGKELKDGDVIPACVQTCPAKARYFGDLEDPSSQVSQLIKSPRAFRLLEEKGTHPKVYYLRGG